MLLAAITRTLLMITIPIICNTQQKFNGINCQKTCLRSLIFLAQRKLRMHLVVIPLNSFFQKKKLKIEYYSYNLLPKTCFSRFDRRFKISKFVVPPIGC